VPNNKTGTNSIHCESHNTSKANIKAIERNSIRNIRIINAQPVPINVHRKEIPTSTQMKGIKAFKVIKPGAKSLANATPREQENVKALKKVQDQNCNISAGNLQHILKNKTSIKQVAVKKASCEKYNSNRTVGNSKSSTAVNINNSVNKVLKEVFPLTSIQALKKYGKELSDFEKGELLDYETIYYMGNGIARYNAESEGGYDDERGDYNTYVGEQVGYRYEIIDILGKGSFGQALKCFDHKSKSTVALKIIRNKKKFYHQATVEVKVLDYIREHDKEDKGNMVRMLDYFTFRKHIVILNVINSVYRLNCLE
jgi:hypothetical protein